MDRKPTFNKHGIRHIAQAHVVATWEFARRVLGENLLISEKGGKGSLLQKAIEATTRKCVGDERALIESMTAKFKSAKPVDAPQFSSLPKAYANQPKDFIKKRMLIAWIEINRIERFLIDRPIANEQKQQLRIRLEKIKAMYPLVATSHVAYTLGQVALHDYRQIAFADSTRSHPQIDEILFPSETDGKYAVVAPRGSYERGHEGLVNQILSQPLSSQIEREIQSLMVSSLSNSFESIGGLCQLNACQTMQLSLSKTADAINESPESQSLTTAAACSCKLLVRTEMVGTGMQLAMTGTAIGGAVLCPITLGLGCFISAAGAAGVTVASVGNTFGAIKDLRQMKPLVVTACALPGLSNESRKVVQQAENRAAGRVIGDIVSTLVGFVSGARMTRQGLEADEMLSTAWRPANPGQMTGYFQTHVREVSQAARDIYKNNIEYFPHICLDVIKALRAHDREKLLSFRILAEKYGYQGVPREIVDDLIDGAKFSHLVSKDGKHIGMSISDALYMLWGHSPDSLKTNLSLANSATERRNIEALMKLRDYVVKSMESIDNAIMLPAYKVAGSAPARVELRLLELMADKAARRGNGITVSEMGRAAYPTRELYDKFGVEGLAKHIADPNSAEEIVAARALIEKIGLENIKRMTEHMEQNFVSKGLPTSLKNSVLNAFPQKPLPSD